MLDKLRMAEQFIAALPYSAALGMKLEELNDGVSVISMPYDERFVGDPRTGVTVSYTHLTLPTNREV